MKFDFSHLPRRELNVVQETLAQVPLFEPSYGGVNWFAKIYRTSNGNLDRYFAPRSHGQFYYRLEPWVVPGTPVEFGADGRQRRRWYGVVVAVTPTQITLVECSDGYSAIHVAKEMKIAVATQLGLSDEEKAAL